MSRFWYLPSSKNGGELYRLRLRWRWQRIGKLAQADEDTAKLIGAGLVNNLRRKVDAAYSPTRRPTTLGASVAPRRPGVVGA